MNVAAVLSYESKSQQNLSFQEGDIITLLEARWDDKNTKQGLCVFNLFILKCTLNLCTPITALAYYFIYLCSPDVSWWKGQNMSTKKVGMFPSEFVESGMRRGT